MDFLSFTSSQKRKVEDNLVIEGDSSNGKRLKENQTDGEESSPEENSAPRSNGVTKQPPPIEVNSLHVILSQIFLLSPISAPKALSILSTTF